MSERRSAKRPDEVIVLRPPRSAWWMTTTAFGVVAAFTVVAFATGLGLTYRLGFLAFCALNVLALVELSRTRVKLTRTHLEVRGSLRRRAIPKQDIAAVTWAKGAGVSLRLADDRWIRLPTVGTSPQATVNAIRAWLARGA